MSDQASIECTTAGLPGGRYKDLLAAVLPRLPERWDEYRAVSVELSDRPSRGYGSAYADEELMAARLSVLEGHQEQVWTVTLYPAWLDRLPDDAVSWVIAHELAHVASGMACGSIGVPIPRARCFVVATQC